MSDSKASLSAPFLSDHYSHNATYWIDIIRQNRDRYRVELTNDAVINSIGVPGTNFILDAGCGEGYMSRILARSGARVTGIDLNSELIGAARRMAEMEGLPIGYDVGTVASMPYADGSFDVVVANHILNDLENITTPISEFSRVLRPDGRLVALLLHPCFYLPHLERDASGGVDVSQYFSVRSIEQRFVVAGLPSPTPVPIWFRPLEDYFASLAAGGFVIRNLSEPHPSVGMEELDPWWIENFRRPMFMLISAQKL
jgi:SAM-dependent methyltransferase